MYATTQTRTVKLAYLLVDTEGRYVFLNKELFNKRNWALATSEVTLLKARSQIRAVGDKLGICVKRVSLFHKLTIIDTAVQVILVEVEAHNHLTQDQLSCVKISDPEKDFARLTI